MSHLDISRRCSLNSTRETLVGDGSVSGARVSKKALTRPSYDVEKLTNVSVNKILHRKSGVTDCNFLQFVNFSC